MKMIPLEAYLILSIVLFGLGVFGMIVRRNMVTVLMSMELALNAVNILFVGADAISPSLEPNRPITKKAIKGESSISISILAPHIHYFICRIYLP